MNTQHNPRTWKQDPTILKNWHVAFKTHPAQRGACSCYAEAFTREEAIQAILDRKGYEKDELYKIRAVATSIV